MAPRRAVVNEVNGTAYFFLVPFFSLAATRISESSSILSLTPVSVVARTALAASSQNLASLLNSFSKVEQPDEALFRHISKTLQVNF
jgi:hypothetical protein